MTMTQESFAEIQQLTRQLPPMMKNELIRMLLSDINPDGVVKHENRSRFVDFERFIRS